MKWLRSGGSGGVITEAVPRYTGSGHGPINGRHAPRNGGYGEVDVPALSRYDLRGSTRASWLATDW